uniref:Translation initiation factor eIF2B subunit beta n=1 Tax=Steinernema glaseri TaxID=37863 RepID=A0A1I8A6F0_9BILA
MKEIGEDLCLVFPDEFVIRNMFVGTVKLVREEAEKMMTDSGEFANPYDSLSKLWTSPNIMKTSIDLKKLKSAAIMSINEFIEELESCRESMASQAADHLLACDVVLTHRLSSSPTLQAFFRAAKKCNRRMNRVLTVDDGPVVDDIASESVSAVDVMSVMRQTTRVVLSAIAVLPDGSCIAPTGSLTICLAAKRHSVPVLFCASFYKLCPSFIPDVGISIGLGSPAAILPFAESQSYPTAEIVNPLFDFIPSHLVSLYITHTSAVAPSHIYRLIGDYYHPSDAEHMREKPTES